MTFELLNEIIPVFIAMSAAITSFWYVWRAWQAKLEREISRLKFEGEVEKMRHGTLLVRPPFEKKLTAREQIANVGIIEYLKAGK